MMMTEEASLKKMVYLHGDLEVKIIRARRLPNKDITTSRIRQCFTCDGCSSSPRSPVAHKQNNKDNAKKNKNQRRVITSDPYAAVVVPQATLARTRVISNCSNPVWDERFLVPMAHPVNHLEIQVKDDDVFGADLIGTVSFPAARISSGEAISGWFPILGSSGKPPKPDSAIEIEMRFTPCEINPVYTRGIAEGGVAGTYFPLRKGNCVTLYQDAHGRDGFLPEIKLEGNTAVYKEEKCWEDICYAITEAHHLIYIVGWSVFHKVRLVREPTKPLPRGNDLTLGDLLKYKSEEGVRVLLLVWDDKTSHSNCFINTVRTRLRLIHLCSQFLLL